MYKNEVHWLVARDTFETHVTYGQYIRDLVANPLSRPHLTARKGWGLKIKNELSKYVYP
jgi:hypothetical protein